MNNNIKIFLCLTLVLFTTACATTPTDPKDPYEHLNRNIFAFNQCIDKHILKPAAQTYNFVIPPHVRTGISNMYTNVGTLAVVADDLLQGDFLNAMGDSWRVFINSTLGIFGFFDIAAQMNVAIPYHYNDFGLTLDHWGINDPKYFVAPLLGPSTDRDFLGIFVDYYAFSPYPWLHPEWTTYALSAGNYVVKRANLLSYDKLMDTASLDAYVFQRDAYLQQRQYLITQMQENLKAEYAPHQSKVGFMLKPSKSW